MSLGSDLADVSFAELVRNLAFAIAEGQLALDRSSIETLQFLLDHNVQIVPEITEIIEPAEREVKVGSNGESITITGANIRASGAAPITLNLLQAGLQPTFYQFSEAEIEIKVSITIRRTEEDQTTSRGGPGIPVSGFTTRAFASSVDYRSANTFSYSADGASVVRVKMMPVPASSRLTPSIVTVNTFTKPPTITTTQ